MVPFGGSAAYGVYPILGIGVPSNVAVRLLRGVVRHHRSVVAYVYIYACCDGRVVVAVRCVNIRLFVRVH